MKLQYIINNCLNNSYMTAGYPYNVDPNYGPVSIVSSEDAAKLAAHPGLPAAQSSASAAHSQAVSIKDERNKESPSPHENSKLSSQQQQVCITFDALLLSKF